MPSAELLAAAAKLTEAEAELRYLSCFFSLKNVTSTKAEICLLHFELLAPVLILLVMFINSFRDAELEHDDGYFIGPPPPALVTEVASTNDAERFEEVQSINFFFCEFSLSLNFGSRHCVLCH